MNLIIVESPTKARTLERFLGKEYQVLATKGHLRDLPKSKLGVDVENGFAPQYEILPGKEKIIGEIKKSAKKAEKVFLASDPDREGEAIAYQVMVLCQPPGDKAKSFARVSFHEITSEAVRGAIKQAGEINLALVDAQTARRVLDRLVGYKLSPVLWKKIRRGLSAGRVQSVVVRLIVEREREIKNFSSQEYWRLEGGFKKDGEIFPASLVAIKDEKIEERHKISLFAGDYTFSSSKIKNEREVLEIMSSCFDSSFWVEEVIKKESRRYPPPPLITSTMQQAANRLLGFSSAQTMRLAQHLYEQGLITYHRTDSSTLAKEAVEKIRALILEKYGANFLPSEAVVYKTRSRVAQEAHEAIRPTDIYRQGINLGGQEEKLYQLIWRQAVASQMTPAIFEKVTAKIKGGLYLFETSGQKLIFPGFRQILGKEFLDSNFPDLKKGEKIFPFCFSPIRLETNSPPRYNEASLIAVLEKEGIGRPSTYAPIITTVENRYYVEKEEGIFRPTALGEAVNDFLVNYFPEIVDLPFTAQMEEGLDEVANGKRRWTDLIKHFYQPFSQKLVKVDKEAPRTAVPVEETGEACPQCGQGKMVVRTGRFGKFLSCSRFPECKYTAAYNERLGIKCPKCGGEVVVRRSKKGRRFYGCANYPRCSWASWRKPTA
ncbi:type I DNA topoisomerase [Candidatus Shapirobacteria bacterium]|nr:type I DNA topoisomerase [Candidatus Shapirobacteria bacterium]